MQKMIRLCCTASVLLLLSHNAFAASSDPVDLVGTETETENASPVDSALSESMEAPVADKDTINPKKSSRTAARPPRETPSSSPASAGNERIIAPAGDKNYTIQAGDVLQVTVWKEADMDREVLVLPDGTVSFPLIGSFTAEGLTPAQVQTTIKKKLATLIPDASVTVLVKATLGHSVSVIGQVAKPGELIMGHSMSVMQALSQVGGLTPFASEGSIIILRRVDGKETAIDFPYDDIIRGRNLDKNIPLLPGDVVVVPTSGLF